jgi:hypothetical protein
MSAPARVISESAVCIVLIFLVSTLLFAATAAAAMILEASLILSRAVRRTLDGTPQRVRRVAALAVREAGILIHTMHG